MTLHMQSTRNRSQSLLVSGTVVLIVHFDTLYSPELVDECADP